MAPFEPVDTKLGFPELEQRVLAFWREADVFHRQLEQRGDGPLWVFYEGPPTANGRPGIHHTESRTFKDIYPRFKAMTGHLVPRKAGWDCHGLPVELEVEKEIGTRSKRDIEAFGIAEFNLRCRESVTRYVDDWERLTERLGFWVDLPDAYWTMNTEYIESVWWSLKRLYQKGLLFQTDRIATYCPRCGTPLSDAEVAMGYAETDDPSIYVRFPLLTGPLAEEGADLLIWTTMPWTLVPNTLAVVSREVDYVLATGGAADDRPVVLAANRLEEALGKGARVIRRVGLGELVRARYRAPFDLLGPGSPDGPDGDPSSWRFVVEGEFVRTDEGTGVVHTGAAFGEDDLRTALEHGAPVVKPVDGEGKFDARCGPYAGMYIRDADAHIIHDLAEAGLLVSAGTYRHMYPFCWRCDTALIYMARTSWYIRTTAVKERLLEVNEQVNWYPEHIKHGRYGDWLENNVDWALSRERYWGTPLPIWRCPNGHDTAIGSLSELSERAGRDVTGIDPHRPAIDEVDLPCHDCGEAASRVPEVIDTWYDSGAMPFAQWGYHPELGRGLERFDERFPADFISEAIDQTRGWFYTLMAEAVLHFDSICYRNCVCLGLIVDEDGRKMSKSLGNALDPFDVLDRQGADALRWYLLTSGSPWASRRVGMGILDDVVRRFLLTLRNIHAFFVTYANASRFEPGERDRIPAAERPPLDRWILSQLSGTVRAARAGLEAYDATGAGRRIDAFVDDLSNWYVRRARPRFWDPGGEGGADTRAAFETLHECLVTLAKLLAPLVPFVAETLWRSLAAGRGGAPDSVHLSDYPVTDETAIDVKLDEAMAAARAIVELGRRIRTETKVKVRQPLLEAVVHFPGDHDALEPLLEIVGQELNVKDVAFAESAEQLGRWRAKPNFKMLGPKLGPRVKEVAEALSQDDGSVAAALAHGERVALELSGASIELGPDDVDLQQETLEGWGVGSEAGITVALELELTPELRREGAARELVRLIQDARKAAGLEVSDRIALGVGASGEVGAALRAHHGYVEAETLAVELVEAEIEGASYRQDADVEGTPVTITLRPA